MLDSFRGSTFVSLLASSLPDAASGSAQVKVTLAPGTGDGDTTEGGTICPDNAVSYACTRLPGASATERTFTFSSEGSTKAVDLLFEIGRRRKST